MSNERKPLPQPTGAGSYVRDPATGELHLQEEPTKALPAGELAPQTPHPDTPEARRGGFAVAEYEDGQPVEGTVTQPEGTAPAEGA